MKDVAQVGVVGCGNIFKQYFKTLQQYDFLKIIRLADIDLEKATRCAEEHSIQHAGSLDDVLNDPEVDVLLNLTVPNVHAEVSLKGLETGKHVYSEKPLATNLEDAGTLLEKAKEKNVILGCAPDTILGTGLQTAIGQIQQGAIGKPIAATAFFLNHGMESWHPNPDFFYKSGGGPILDLGPYYVTALIHLVGPIVEVSGTVEKTFKERTITSKEKYGGKIKVEIPTFVTGSLRFQSGAIGNIISTWDVWGHHLPPIEIHGTDGSLSVPDPNCFEGEVKVYTPDANEWKNISMTDTSKLERGIGLADMVRAIKTGKPHRARADVAYHALEVMLAFEASARAKKHIQIQSSCALPDMPTQS